MTGPGSTILRVNPVIIRCLKFRHGQAFAVTIRHAVGWLGGRRGTLCSRLRSRDTKTPQRGFKMFFSRSGPSYKNRDSGTERKKKHRVSLRCLCNSNRFAGAPAAPPPNEIMAPHRCRAPLDTAAARRWRMPRMPTEEWGGPAAMLQGFCCGRRSAPRREFGQALASIDSIFVLQWQRQQQQHPRRQHPRRPAVARSQHRTTPS